MSTLPARATAKYLAAFALTISLHAQVNTSTIAGMITDQTGSVVSNARVVATLLATGQQRESSSNNLGEYVFAQLAPGTYRVNVTAPGFQTAVVDHLTL